MAAPTDTTALVNGPVADAPAVQTKFDRLFAYVQAGVDTYVAGSVNAAALASGAVTAAKIARLPAVRVYNSAAQSVPNAGAGAVLSFDTERHDTLAMHSTSVNPTRLTVVQAGLHRVFAHVLWSTASANTRRLAELVVNGSKIIAREDRNSSANGDSAISLETDYVFAVGNYIELRVYHEHGSALTVAASDGANVQECCEFGATFISA